MNCYTNKTYKCAGILELLSELLAGLNEAVEATELTLGLRVWLNKFIMGLEEPAGELGLSVGLFWPVGNCTGAKTLKSLSLFDESSLLLSSLLIVELIVLMLFATTLPAALRFGYKHNIFGFKLGFHNNILIASNKTHLYSRTFQR